MSRRIGRLVLASVLVLLGAGGGRARQQDDAAGVAAANRPLHAGDLARIDQVWAHGPYVRAIHPTNLHVDAGWEAGRAGWERLFANFPAIDAAMPEPQIRVGQGTAWVTGAEQFRGRRPSGEEVAATLPGTSVFEQVDGRWLMVHHHVSVPFRPKP